MSVVNKNPFSPQMNLWQRMKQTLRDYGDPGGTLVWKISQDLEDMILDVGKQQAKALGRKDYPMGICSFFGIRCKVVEGQTEPFYLDELT